MNENKDKKLCKEISIEKYEVLKSVAINNKVRVYQIVKIVDSKVTFVVWYAHGLNPLDGDKTKVSLCTIEQLGESMTLKCKTEIIDDIISSFGDILPMIWCQDGIVTSILTFELINSDTLTSERLRECLLFFNRK